MNITFLGSGSATDETKTPSSVLFSNDEHNILVDCSPAFTEQATRESVSKIDVLILTHGHDDAIGGISQLQHYLNGQRIPAIMLPETLDAIKAKGIDTDFLDIKFFTPYIQFSLGETNITPFMVRHTLNKETERLFPTVGLAIDKVVYAEDVGEIPGQSLPFFQNADILVLDAKTWFGTQEKGHLNVKTALELGKQFKPRTLVLTQGDETYPLEEKATVLINKHWKRIRGNKNTKLILAKDGLKLTSKLMKQNLRKEDYGIYLAQPNAELIQQGKKQLILKAENIKGIERKLLYLIQSDRCYGIIRVTNKSKVHSSKFGELNKFHCLSEDNRKQWWPSQKILYAYKFDVIEMFKIPKRVELKQCLPSFVDSVSFLEEVEALPVEENKTEEKLKCKPFKRRIQVPKRKTMSSINELNNYPYYLEEKTQGISFIAEKIDGHIELFLKKTVPPSIICNFMKIILGHLSPNDYIIEGTYTEDKQLVVNDILMFNNQDLREVPLRTRKLFLSKLDMKEGIREAETSFITCQEELAKYTDKLDNYILKEVDSEHQYGETESYMEIKLGSS